MALELTFHHNNEGEPISGSVDALIEGIVNGRRVRAVLEDDVGYIAYDHFVTLRIDGSTKLVNAVLPVRPATNDGGVLFEAFGQNVAVIDTAGRYTRLDGLGASGTFERQYAVRWFLD